MAMNSMAKVRVAIITIWALAIVAVILIIGPGHILHAYRMVTPWNIRYFILSFGPLSAIVFILINVIRPFTFLPQTPFTIAGGFIFGHFYGLLLSLIGTMLSAVLTFSMSRYLFRDQIKQWLKGRFDGVDRKFDGSGIFMVAAVRVIPVIPFDAVGYVAGISNIRFRDYMIGSLIGELPGAFVLTMLGSSLGRIGSPIFYVSMVLFILLMAIPELYKRIVQWRAGRYKK